MEDTTNRTGILFNAIEEYIKPDYSFLDIGCGYSPLYLGTALSNHIHDAFPEATYCGLDTIGKIIEHCRNDHPDYTWVCTPAEEFEIDRQYDFIIHTGIDKWWSNGWKIHNKLLTYKELPSYVLLEAGDNEHSEVRGFIEHLYTDSGYRNIEHGSYVWDLTGINQPHRTLLILGKP